MKNKFKPLSHIEPEQDGVAFSKLHLPVGLDEERILINVGTIKKIARIAGFGLVELSGYNGEHGSFSVMASGVNTDGSVSLSAARKTQKAPYTGQIIVGSDKEETSSLEDYPTRSSQDYFNYPPVTIEANLTARSELLENDKYQLGQFDVNGHVDFLQETLASGLSAAALKRYEERPDSIFSKYLLTSLLVINGSPMLQGQSFNLTSFSSTLAIWGSVTIGLAKVASVIEDENYKDAQISTSFGVDRLVLAGLLSKTATLAKAQK
ncbi:hypothetical protein KC874_03060 [Candidatus Saccharibacteria bacterium]|nr:hypothetical protein [Candidatus Saccharibacteria bacterium]